MVRHGQVSRVDGPYAEAKEVVGGWVIMPFDTCGASVADQQEFAELHAKHRPEVTVIATLRQNSTGPEAPGGSVKRRIDIDLNVSRRRDVPLETRRQRVEAEGGATRVARCDTTAPRRRRGPRLRC